MSPSLVTSPGVGVFASPDWESLGIVASMVGAFLIANGTLLEHPRRLVSRYFGRNSGRLQTVREYVYNRVQTTLGFAFLLVGFGMQLVGNFRARPVGEPVLSMAWVGVIVVAAVVLLFTAWWWSLVAFRRYVREYFQNHPISLEREGVVAREIGELFGVDPEADDTVQTYAARVRNKVGLPLARAKRFSAAFVEDELESDADLEEAF